MYSSSGAQGAWKSLEGRFPPGDPLRVFQSIELFVCVASHIYQGCLGRGTLQIPPDVFSTEMDNPPFVGHVGKPLRVHILAKFGSPKCQIVFLFVKLVH